MAVIPDFSAIRAVRKKTKRVKKKESLSYKAGGKHEPNSLSERQKAEDAELLESIRRQEMRSLLNELVEKGIDEPDVVLGDAELLHAWKVQNIRGSLEERAGPALKEGCLSLVSETETKPPLESIADSDGDIDVTHVAQLLGTATPAEANNPQLQVVYRDQDGFKITREKWLEYQRQKKGGYKPQIKTAKPLKEQPAVAWGKGLCQERELENRLAEERETISKPLAQYDIDDKLDKELKKKVHWGDPFSKIESETSTDHIVSLPKCPFPSPPNRFNIKSGYRWDGVVRGNGFEQRFLKERNKIQLQKTEGYKWSIEDV